MQERLHLSLTLLYPLSLKETGREVFQGFASLTFVITFTPSKKRTESLLKGLFTAQKQSFHWEPSASH